MHWGCSRILVLKKFACMLPLNVVLGYPFYLQNMVWPKIAFILDRLNMELFFKSNDWGSNSLRALESWLVLGGLDIATLVLCNKIRSI